MSDTCDLVFVAGASRSGTTLLARSLGLHDQCHTLEETHYFGEVTTLSPAEPSLSQDKARQILARLLARDAHGLFRESLEREHFLQADQILSNRPEITRVELFRAFANYAAVAKGKRMAVEHTPRNIFYAEKLLKQYPNSRFVEIIRDPRAVLYSQRERWRIRFAGGQDTPLIQSLRVFVNYHAITMALLWVSAVKAGLKMKEHNRFMRVRYEDLVNAPEDQLRRICTFLGLDFQDSMLRAPHTTTSTRPVSREGRGFYTSSTTAWKDRLPTGERALCEVIARDHARRLGYDLSTGRMPIIPILLHLLRYPFHVVGTVLLNPNRLVVQIRSVFRFYR